MNMLTLAQGWMKLIESSLPYNAAVDFYGLYPLVTAIIWATTAIMFYVRRERVPVPMFDQPKGPMVSVLIPAYCEEAVIADVVQGALSMDYPDFEVIVINDASTDATTERVRPFLADPRVHLIDKPQNEGKARGLNDGIRAAQGELVLIMDADAIPDPMLLRYMVPHFSSPKVGGVAGNARVRNKSCVLARLQAVEFTSIISLLRRAQRVWGAIMCVSGVVGMFRKSALVQAGMFSPGMATEDIDLTWKIQTRGYDVRYEPRALVWMIVPESLSMWWKQRKRWATGLGQVLHRHCGVLFSWESRRLLPLYFEAVLSTVWSINFVCITLYWCLAYALGHSPRGASPFPNTWGMLLVTVCLLQLGCGLLIDSRYERGIIRQFHIAPLYPIGYWMLLAICASIYTVKGVFQRLDLERPTRWRIEHRYQEG